MRIPAENLAPVPHAVNPLSSAWLRAAIRHFATLTGQNLAKRRRAPYLRRLNLLAAGSPRGMNFARSWCIALHNLSDLPPNRTYRRDRVREAWTELLRAAEFVVAEIQAAARGRHD